MASEDLLKKAVAAFNALSPEQQAEMMEEQRQSWVRGNVGLSRDERGMTSPVMPRPAPAATDTGLVTVAWQRQSSFYSDGWGPVDAGHAQKLAEAGELVRELVTRSQAEELSAAERDKVIVQTKRAELAELKERWLKEMVAAITSNPIGSPKHFRAVEDARRALNNPEASLYALYEKEELIQRVEKAEADNAAKDERLVDCRSVINELKREIQKLEADNAAQAARIMELEQVNAVLMGDDEDKPRYTTKRLKHEISRATEALEAKLAAAEKALERAEFGFDQIHQSLMSNGPKQASGEVTAFFLAETRAVLGGKPS